MIDQHNNQTGAAKYEPDARSMRTVAMRTVATHTVALCRVQGGRGRHVNCWRTTYTMHTYAPLTISPTSP